MNVPLIAEPIFHIGTFTVTNALINSTALMLILVVFAFFFQRSIKTVPGKLQSAFEALIDFLLGYFDQVTGSRVRSRQFLPLVGTLFLFILLSNWLGLLPGTGSIGVWHMIDGERELVPILRSANSDLNLTLAMALLSILSSHIIGMSTVGFFVHWNRFIQLGSLWKAIASLNPTKILVGAIEFVVGFIELFSEVAKVLSLSLRLFGNIFAGEVLITIISGIMSVVVPLPFMALELLVGLVQAVVFSMLTLVYLSILTEKPHHEDDRGHEHAEELAGEMMIGEPSAHPASLA
jgi:F-type H+-transporting ATPase subunit a